MTVDRQSLAVLGSCEATISRKEWLDAAAALPTVADVEVAPSPGLVYAKREGSWYEVTPAVAASPGPLPLEALIVGKWTFDMCERVLAYWRERDVAMDDAAMLGGPEAPEAA